MMWILSPSWAAAESPSLIVGMSAASIRSSARSRPDMASPTTGGLYFVTTATRFRPFGSTTETTGSSLTLAVGNTVTSAWRASWSSMSGRSPGFSPCLARSAGTQPARTPCSASSFESQAGG